MLLGLVQAEKLDSAYAGIGPALIVVGAFQTLRNLRYRKDPAYREKLDTEFSDERNNFIRMKSWTWTGIFVVIVEGIGGIIAMVLGERTVQLTLSYSVCLLLVVYWITYLVFSRKY